MGALACKTKIIIDGQNLIGLTSAICEGADSLDPALLTDELAYPIIENLNKAEACVIEAQKRLLKIVEYDGPLPKFLKS